MAVPGRKPKPRGLRLVEGNPGHRPIPDAPRPAPIRSAMYAPRWLGKAAKGEWRRIVPKLTRLGLLTEIDLTAIEAYCSCYAKWREAEEKAEIAVFKTDSGYVGQNPFINIAMKYLGQLRKYQVEFGLTPSSRTRVSVAGAAGEHEDEDLD